MKIDIKRQYRNRAGINTSYFYLVDGSERVKLATFTEDKTGKLPANLSHTTYRFKKQVQRSLDELKRLSPGKFTQEYIKQVWLELEKKMPHLFLPGESGGLIKGYHQLWRARNPVRWKAIQSRWYSLVPHREQILESIRSANLGTARGPYKPPEFGDKKFWPWMHKIISKINEGRGIKKRENTTPLSSKYPFDEY